MQSKMDQIFKEVVANITVTNDNINTPRETIEFCITLGANTIRVPKYFLIFFHLFLPTLFDSVR